MALWNPNPGIAGTLVLAAMLAWPAAADEAPVPTSTRYQQAVAFDGYSACVVGRSPQAAALALEAGYTGGELRGRMQALMPALKACLQQEQQELLRISPFLLRGEMARALWLKGVPAPRPYAPPGDADLAGRNGARAREEQVSAEFAACLIGSAPVGSADFVRALSGSPEEQRAFASVKTATDGCTVKGDEDMVLGGDRLRAALAIALFGRSAVEGAG